MIQIKENEIIEFKATYQEGLFDTEAKECTYTIACMDVFKNKELLEKYKIDCIITDPPYNLLDHKIETGINTDKMFSLFYEYLPKNSFCSFFGQHPGLNDFLNSAYKAGFKYKAEIIWDKMGISNPFGDVLRSHENNIVLTKGSQRVYDNEISFEKWMDEEYILKAESLKREVGYWKSKAQGGNDKGMCNSRPNKHHEIYRHFLNEKQTCGTDTKRIQSVWHEPISTHKNNIIMTKGSQRVYDNKISFEKWMDEEYILKATSLKKELSYWKAKAQGKKVINMCDKKPNKHHKVYNFSGKVLTLGRDTKRIQSVWHVYRDQMSKKGQKSHVTQKPLEFMSRLVKMLSKEGQLVCDPFGGSGSTLLSCLKIRRDCIMYEIHEDIANFAIHRLLTYFDDFDIKYSYKKY